MSYVSRNAMNHWLFFFLTTVSYVTRFSTSSICDIMEQIDWEHLTLNLTDQTHDTYITVLPGAMVMLIVGVRHRNKTLMHVRTAVSVLTCHPRQLMANGLANCTVANNVTSCERHIPCVMLSADDERGFDDNTWTIITCHFRCSCKVECGFFVLRVSTENSQTTRIYEISGMWPHAQIEPCRYGDP